MVRQAPNSIVVAVALVGVVSITYTAAAQCRLIPDYSGLGSFGDAVAVSGDVAFVGSPGNVRAFLFRNDGAAWPQAQMLIPDSCTSGCRFGKTLAIDGHVALIGAPDDDI